MKSGIAGRKQSAILRKILVKKNVHWYLISCSYKYSDGCDNNMFNIVHPIMHTRVDIYAFQYILYQM